VPRTEGNHHALRAFEALNEKQEEAGSERYAQSAPTSPRARSASSIRRSQIAGASIFYGKLFAGRRGRADAPCHSEALEALANMHLQGAPDWRVCSSLDAVKNFQSWEGSAQSCRRIDGIVIKLNEIALQQELGFTAKGPAWAVAVISGASRKTTVVNDVDFFKWGAHGTLRQVPSLSQWRSAA